MHRHEVRNFILAAVLSLAAQQTIFWIVLVAGYHWSSWAAIIEGFGVAVIVMPFARGYLDGRDDRREVERRLSDWL